MGRGSFQTSKKPITSSGYAMSPEEINEEKEGVEAILAEDKLVLMTDWLRIRAGDPRLSGGLEQWFWKEIKDLPPGTYNLIRSLPELIKSEVDRRKQSGKSYKLFQKQAETFGYQFIHDEELLRDAFEDGIVEWLKNQ